MGQLRTNTNAWDSAALVQRGTDFFAGQDIGRFQIQGGGAGYQGGQGQIVYTTSTAPTPATYTTASSIQGAIK